MCAAISGFYLALPPRSLCTAPHSPRHTLLRQAQKRRHSILALRPPFSPYKADSTPRRYPPRPCYRQSIHTTTPSYATKNPYDVLGLGKDASTSDIKKAYYSLAKKYHPDTNKTSTAKDRFSEAQSAYEMLSDPKKKEAWDHYGAAAFDQGPGFDPGSSPGGPFGAGGGFGGASGPGFGTGGFGADINFEDLFGAFTGGGRRGRGQRQSPFQAEEVLVGQNIETQTSISFMDAAKGVNKVISITPLCKCKTCNGLGLRKGFERTQCKKCGGSGTRVHFMQAGFQMASTCDTCSGTGVVVPRGGECTNCSGQGAVRQRKSVDIDIPGGVEDGMRLRVSGEGDAPATGTATNPSTRSANGDLYVFIRVASDSKFGRSGADVLYTASIPLTTATLGGEILIPTLDGEVRLKIATGTTTGDKVTLPGMGMLKVGGRRNAMGDLKVAFKVAMPKYLNSNQRAILEMLADELGDTTAKRIMNVGNDSSAATSSSTPSSSTSESHQNEGFLKAAWHKLTHQHDPPSPDKATPTETVEEGKSTQSKESEEEPKKASGSL